MRMFTPENTEGFTAERLAQMTAAGPPAPDELEALAARLARHNEDVAAALRMPATKRSMARPAAQRSAASSFNAMPAPQR
jgi:hypothetical protein